MNRALQVMRIQTFTPYNGLFWPWAIMASAFAVNVALFAAIGDTIPDGPKTGGLASIFITAIIVGAVLVTQHLPFMLGFGVTRRTFLRATSLLTLAWALASGIGLYLCALVERATDGWGIRMTFFDFAFLARDNPIIQILEYAVPLALMAFLGLLLGAVHLRFGTTGIMVMTIASMVVFGGLAILITWQRWWEDFFGWFADQPLPMLIVVWPAVLTAACAAGTYLAVRRATPQ